MESTERETYIRWITPKDCPIVLEIENNCFEFAWTEEEFTRCLRQRNCICMVAEKDNEVVGFMIYELHANRIHLLNFAVHEDHRRQGVGKSMVSKLLDKLSHEYRNRIMLEVSETNLVAQLFFKAMGFRATFILKEFYDDQDTKEDAYLMEHRYRPSESELNDPNNRLIRSSD